MKILLLIALTSLSIHAIAQTNSYPTTGDVTIYNYSPNLILQRNTTDGGFTEGIQTRLHDGTDNWYFGALHTGQWVVSKGNYANAKMVVLDNGNVGIGITTPTSKLEIFNTAQEGQLILSTNDNPSADESRIDLDYKIANTNQTIGRISSAYLNSANGGSGALRLYTRNDGVLGEKMKIDNNGNVGIGIRNPQYKLDVNGDSRIGDLSARHYLKIASPEWPEIRFETPSSNEKIRIGVAHGDNSNYRIQEGDLYFYTMDIDAMPFILKKSGNVLLNTTSGNTGIGTTNPAYKLDVLGTIRAKEVLVNLDGGADFVFEKDYKLPTIEHVANYVQENKHLPDIPSANEMVKNGVSMGDLQVKLLQKVEELTLYAIQQDKSKKELEAKLAKQENQYNALLEKVEMLTKQIEKK